MYTESIFPTYGSAYNLRQDSKSSEAGAKEGLRGERRSIARFSSASLGRNMDEIADNVTSLLSDIGGNGKVTFAKVKEYKEKLEKEFSEKMKKDLLELGVDKDIEFRLVAQQNGGVAVVSDHKDKALIEKYLKANPDMAKKFTKIEMLGNLDRARAYQGVPMSQVSKEIQLDAVNTFFTAAAANGMGMASLMMDLGPGGYTSGMAGLNLRV